MFQAIRKRQAIIAFTGHMTWHGYVKTEEDLSYSGIRQSIWRDLKSYCNTKNNRDMQLCAKTSEQKWGRANRTLKMETEVSNERKKHLHKWWHFDDECSCCNGNKPAKSWGTSTAGILCKTQHEGRKPVSCHVTSLCGNEVMSFCNHFAIVFYGHFKSKFFTQICVGNRTTVYLTG